MYETDGPKHVAERYDWKYILIIALWKLCYTIVYILYLHSYRNVGPVAQSV